MQRLANFKICRISQETVEPGKRFVAGQVWRPWFVEFPLPQGRSVFFLMPSTDWTTSTHIKQDNLFYSKSTRLIINLISKNTFTAKMFDQISGCDSSAQLRHVNYHTNWSVIEFYSKHTLNFYHHTICALSCIY